MFDVSGFRNLRQAQARIDAWRREYNTERPHSSLGYQTPVAFRDGCAPSPRGLQGPQILAPVKAEPYRSPAAALTAPADFFQLMLACRSARVVWIS
jgi:hypothetical protein